MLAYILNLTPKMFYLFGSALTCLIITLIWVIAGQFGGWYSRATKRPWEDLEKEEKTLKEFRKAARMTFLQRVTSTITWLVLSWGVIFLTGYGVYVYYLKFLT